MVAKVEDEGHGAKAWSSATFYNGPASDALLPNHPNASVREAWARRKVDWVPTKNPHETHSYDYWWDYDDEAEDGNLPCTQYIQHRLHALMNPYSCETMPTSADRNLTHDDPFCILEHEVSRASSPPSPSPPRHTRFFVGEFRDKSMGYGAGAVFYLTAHEFLQAIALKRVLLLKQVGGRLSRFVAAGGGQQFSRWSYASDAC